MDTIMTELCGELHNHFVIKPDGVHKGRFTIDGKRLTVDFLQEGQYFRIVGSVFNDGVHVYPASDLQNEEFNGEVWAMAVPPAVIALADEIGDWEEQYSGASLSPFTSESFNNYSYSKATGTNADGSYAPVTWRSVFAPKIARFKRLP